MSQPLQYYYKPLKREFGGDLRSCFLEDGVVRKFIGFEIYSPSLLADLEIEKVRSIIGDGYKVFFQPNNERIYIE